MEGEAGLARRGTQRTQPRRLHGTLDVDRIVVCDLADGTAVQGLRFLHEYEIQVSEQIPLGRRAALAVHFFKDHLIRCDTATCPTARAWLPAESIRSAGAIPGEASA